MYSILLSAGWPIWPLLIISIIGLAIVLERSWYLRQIHIFPKGCLETAFSLCNQLLKDNKPSDGQIHWNQSASQVHNLIRAVAPPYPGAFTDWQGQTMIVARSSLQGPFPAKLDLGAGGIQVVDNQVFGICGDQQAVAILDWFPAKTH
mgnify:CR=1 FL=1